MTRAWLVTGRARPELPQSEHARRMTENLVHLILRRESELPRQDELETTADEVRSIFSQLIRD